MEEDHLTDDGEAQAGAARLAGAGLVDPVEAVEDVGDGVLGDAGAVVLDGEDGVPGGAVQGDDDAAALLGVFDGVFHQVVDHLVHLALVGVHLAGILDVDDQLLAALSRHRVQAVAVFLDQVLEGQLFAGQLDGAGVHAHQGQQVADDGAQPVDFPVDVLEELRAQALVHIRLVDQGFQQHLHGGQRGFELVGGVGDELVSGDVQRLDLFAHGVEGLRQPADLSAALFGGAGGKIAPGHLLDGADHPAQRPGQDAGKDEADRRGGQGGQEEDDQHLAPQVAQARHHVRHRADQHQHADDVVARDQAGGAVAGPGPVQAEGEDQAVGVDQLPGLPVVDAEIGALPALHDGVHLFGAKEGARPFSGGVQMDLAPAVQYEDPAAELALMGVDQLL